MSQNPEPTHPEDDEGLEDATLDMGPQPVPRQRPTGDETSSLEDATLDGEDLDLTLDAGSEAAAPPSLEEEDPTLEATLGAGSDVTLGAEGKATLEPREATLAAEKVPTDFEEADELANSQLAEAPQVPDLHIEEVIGRGGQGVVYRGRQVYLDRAVAVKVLAGGTSARFQARFQREAKILAGMQHPHVVSCYQAGVTEDGRCFMIMELIEGPDLSQWIRAHGALALQDALTVGRDIAQALEHGHQASIIHRDVKPQNVLLARSESGGEFGYRAKLADLGLARGTEEDSDVGQLTAEGAILGTPSTMAPEQFDDPDEVDFRADIYGLGCVLFQALTGQKAFQGKGFTSALKQKIRDDAPDPSTYRSDLPAPVVALVKRMLAPDRGDRHPSYADLIADLEGLLAGLDGGNLPGPKAATRQASAARPLSRLVWVGLPLVAIAGGAVVWFGPREPSPEPGDSSNLAGLEEVPSAPLELESDPPQPNDDEALLSHGVAKDDPEEVSESTDPTPPAPSQVFDNPSSTGKDEGPTLDPALAPGQRVVLFEAWAIDDLAKFMEGWSVPERERPRWFGEEDSLHILNANTPRGGLKAKHAVPDGAWSLEGRFEVSSAYGAEADSEPRAGVALLWSSGARLELSVEELGGRRWSFLVPQEGAEPMETGQRDGPMPVDFRFEVVESRQVALFLGEELAMRVEAVEQGPPVELELFVETGVGRWADFVFVGQ